MMHHCAAQMVPTRLQVYTAVVMLALVRVTCQRLVVVLSSNASSCRVWILLCFGTTFMLCQSTPSESKSMSASKFLKELVTGSPERKAAREASRRNPSIYRFVMFVAGFLVCAYTLLEGRGNWLLIVLTVVCAVAAYSEVRKYQKLDQTLFD